MSNNNGKSLMDDPITLDSLDRYELLIWAAGFFEGEGSITIEPRSSSRWKGIRFYRKLRLGVSQKYKEPYFNEEHIKELAVFGETMRKWHGHGQQIMEKV